LGGIGSCGRELCCSTWLTDFRSVSTAAARYQQLSINQQKLAGQCGKLKCCLNYELDQYVEALKAFPRTDIKLVTEKGKAFHVKTDVFKKQMWYLYENNSEGAGSGFIPLKPERVKEIIKLNKEGKKPADLKEFIEEVVVKEPDYTNVVGQDSLNRFEHVFKRKKKKSKKNKPGHTQNAPKQPQQQQGTTHKKPKKSSNNIKKQTVQKSNNASNGEPKKNSNFKNKKRFNKKKGGQNDKPNQNEKES
jgi:hypothetical protein